MSLPASGWRVRVSGRQATTDAHVLRSEPGRLILRIPDGACGAFAVGEAVAVEWVTERGLRSATGSVVFETAAGPALGVLMADGSAARSQRRRHVRAPMHAPVVVARRGAGPGSPAPRST